MTKEQAIERLKKMIQINNGVIKEARKNGDIFAMQLTADLDTDSIAIETVLSMLEEKDKIIQFKEDINNTALDRHKNTKKSLKGIIKKQNRIIDLMSEQLAGLTIFDVDKDEPLILGDKDDVKQYFEEKAKEIK